MKLTYLPFFAKAAIDALKEHPKLNAHLDLEKGEITYWDRENVAFAVDTDRGLLTPVVKDAGDLSTPLALPMPSSRCATARLTSAWLPWTSSRKISSGSVPTARLSLLLSEAASSVTLPECSHRFICVV